MERRKRGRPKGSTKKSKSEKQNDAVDERYERFKQRVPLLYDWFAYHHLDWPSLSCRWGSIVENGRQTNKQRLYLSEQTDRTEANTLIIAECEVVKPRVAAASHISNFNEGAKSPYVKTYKTILHPGEVNRIRELPQNKNIVATHTDSPEVLIWDIIAQPNRSPVLGSAESRPDLVLSGHEDIAEFALAMCPAEPFVLSGGKDKLVVLWSIQDHISTLAADATHSAGSVVKAAENSTVDPRGVFKGHTDTVEDVQFCPSTSQQFCSVGDDSCLILWDARVGSDPITKVEKAHNADLHCVDWNSHDQNYIVTGSADHTACMFDCRKLTSDGVESRLHKFEGHTAAVLCVQWCPDKRTVLGSSAEDGLVNIWDSEKVGVMEETGSKAPGGLFFQHAGHRDKVVDFHWNESDPWTIASVSENGESSGGGGTLQLWRVIDLLYRPKEEVVAELQKYKDHVQDCLKDTTK